MAVLGVFGQFLLEVILDHSKSPGVFKTRQGTKRDADIGSVTSCFIQALGKGEAYWGSGSPPRRLAHDGPHLCSLDRAPVPAEGAREAVGKAVYSSEPSQGVRMSGAEQTLTLLSGSWWRLTSASSSSGTGELVLTPQVFVSPSMKWETHLPSIKWLFWKCLDDSNILPRELLRLHLGLDQPRFPR